MATQARQLTSSEIADFMIRHPLDADYVASTKIAIATGVYDWVNTWPGVIPPWGMQEDDSKFGTVTIFFGQGDGQLYVIANSPVLGDINKPPYVPPPFKCRNGGDPILGVCPEDVTDALGPVYLIGFGLALYFGYQLFFAKKHA